MKLKLTKTTSTIFFVLLFILIFSVIPKLFPHNNIIFWIINILAILFVIAVIVDSYSSRKKKN
ncbi:hypothetical protein MAQA_07563 [Listeria aquatica FSL S10-1188]|uniref:Uncharacterized protein n=1 Tax=Listeria aquatica FSL S10-1188 TaxID=1265818 RepID=W7AZA9_9LIST|nr:hypothetical protein MAQA_07563 [Listeria aquatica FSL S10-1188]